MKAKELLYRINLLDSILQTISKHSIELGNIAGDKIIDAAYIYLHEYRQMLLDKEVAE